MLYGFLHEGYSLLISAGSRDYSVVNATEGNSPSVQFPIIGR